MLSLEKDDTNIETDLISRLQIELKSSNTIFNFIIYDERVDPTFGNYEQCGLRLELGSGIEFTYWSSGTWWCCAGVDWMIIDICVFIIALLVV